MPPECGSVQSGSDSRTGGGFLLLWNREVRRLFGTSFHVTQVHGMTSVNLD